MRIQRPKSQKQGQRWISCLKEPTICQNCQLVKFAQKLRESRLLKHLVKIIHFLGQRWDHQSPYHLATLD